MSLIKLENLIKIYQDNGFSTPALKGINLEVENGEYVAIMGPSGSGKSTLLQISGLLERFSGGQYFFEDKEISKYSDDELAYVRNKKIGFIFQNFNLLPRFSILENVKLPLLYDTLKEKRRTELAMEKIKLVSLEDRMYYPASKLSGGQKQRVAIARALINNPKLILADEPTGSLDSKSGEVILKFFEDVHNLGTTIILVTHEAQVAECAERIVRLKDGLIEKQEKNENRRIVTLQGFNK